MNFVDFLSNFGENLEVFAGKLEKNGLGDLFKPKNQVLNNFGFLKKLIFSAKNAEKHHFFDKIH